MSMNFLRDRSIQWKVAGHLLLILLLVGANLAGVWWFLHEQENDGTAIDKAGKQRMLVQKMVLEAHLIGMGNVDQRDELAADAAKYNRTLTALVKGNTSMGVSPAPPAVRGQLLRVRAEWEPFYAHVRTILEKPRASQEFNESLAYVESNNGQLLAVSDAAVQQYERTFEKKIARAQLFLVGIFGLDLLLISLLFVFIDRHILRPIKQLISEAQTIARGEMDQSITVVDATDEVGTLSRSLHEMKDQLVSAVRDARRFEQAVEHAGHAIYITDTDGTIEYINPAFEEITKYTEDEAVGENPRILKSGHQSESYYEELWDTILSGGVWEEEFVDKRASGELFHAHQTIAPLTGEDGDLDGFVAIMNDNTEQIVSEQQTQVLGRVLRHNLRTECNLIDGYAQELVKADDADTQAEYVRHIRDSVETLVELSSMADQCMREFQEETYRQSQSVCASVERVCTSLESRYPQASITTELPAYEINVLTNIEGVLEEVVENAIQHNDQERPEVAVTVYLEEEETEPPPRVRIEIEDNGPGIPPAEREVIEEGEETPLFHGSGLGLWRVYWTVTLAGGHITIEDRSPRGTCIVLTLPRASVSPFPRNSSSSENETPPPTNQGDQETYNNND